MLDPEALAKLSATDRRKLLRTLVALEQGDTPAPGSSWKWDAVLVVIVAACIVLAAWIGVLAVTLPKFYHTGSWRGAWVGFDIALLATFAATGWTAWRRRQLLIICLVVLATLLLCDAWFDVVLDVRTPGFLASLLSALLVELPLALLAIAMARRLLRLTIGPDHALRGPDESRAAAVADPAARPDRRHTAGQAYPGEGAAADRRQVGRHLTGARYPDSRAPSAELMSGWRKREPVRLQPWRVAPGRCRAAPRPPRPARPAGQRPAV